MQALSSLPRPKGMQAFYTIWIGQFLSLLGTGMTRFALTLWAWELTGSATALALVAFFSFVPSIIMRPIAGALVDRWNKKFTMMFSDLAAGMGTVLLFILALLGWLDIWHVYIVAFFAGIFESFQFPAYSSAISTMVDKSQFARTSGMMGLAESASGIISPIAAAALYAMIGLQGILLLDIFSFVFAYITLMIIELPPAKRSAEGAESRSAGFWNEVSYGFRFIWKRKSLFWLQTSFFFANFLFGSTLTLTSAMILARTNNDEGSLAIVNTFLGIGGLVGGIIVSTWGGFKERRIRGVHGGFMFHGLTVIILGMGQSLPVWALGAFLFMFILPLVNASNQAIWQSKTPPDIQGKVFAARSVIAMLSTPIAMILGGLLADYIFEPAMRVEGKLAPIFGDYIGLGDGAGMGLMFVCVGIGIMLVGIISYSIPILRNVESLVPDFDEEVMGDE